MVRSHWQITFDPDSSPLTICTIGQRIEAEPAWPWEQAVQVAPRVRGGVSRIYARGNAIGGLSITTLVDYNTDADARAACLALQATLGGKALVTAPLEVEIESGPTYRAAHAAIRSAEAVRVVEAVKARVRITWRVEASGWAVVTP